jgi:hypothetical protein
MLNFAIWVARSKLARSVAGVCALSALLGATYALHTLDKRNAVEIARNGWVRELDVQVLERRVVLLNHQIKVERSANEDLDVARLEAERQMQILEQELTSETQDYKTNGCVASDDLFNRLRR